jgi:hypothetical protein
MLERSEYMPLQFMKKQKWSGSYQGMRFMFQKAKEAVPLTEEELQEAQKAADEAKQEEVPTEKEIDILEVVCWKEPYSYECTPEEERTVRHFPLTEEGREEGIAWLEEEYEVRKEEWRKAMKWDWEK